MLGWVITFLLIALIAGIFGFTGVAGAAVGIARVLFAVFLPMNRSGDGSSPNSEPIEFQRTGTSRPRPAFRGAMREFVRGNLILFLITLIMRLAR